MIIPVMCKHIKTHAAKHILHIFFIISGQNLCKFHQTMIIQTWLFKIQFQKCCCRQHMKSFSISLSIESTDSKIPLTYI